MKTIEEVGEIFVDEARKIIENNYKEFSDLTNSMLNKDKDSIQKYQVLLQRFKSGVEFGGKRAALLEADGILLKSIRVGQNFKILVELHKGLGGLVINDNGVHLTLL